MSDGEGKSWAAGFGDMCDLNKELAMKTLLPVIFAVLLATLAACQTTDTGSPPTYGPSSEGAAPSMGSDRPEIERGDVYKEQMLDRYEY